MCTLKPSIYSVVDHHELQFRPNSHELPWKLRLLRSRRLTHGLTERDRLRLLWKFSCSSTIVETSNTSKHKWSVRPSQRGQRTSAFQPGVKQLFNYFQLICSLPLDFIGRSLNYSWAIPHRWWLIVPAKNRFILQMLCSWIVNVLVGKHCVMRTACYRDVWALHVPVYNGVLLQRA